jgi:hypothetical protein
MKEVPEETEPRLHLQPLQQAIELLRPWLLLALDKEVGPRSAHVHE